MSRITKATILPEFHSSDPIQNRQLISSFSDALPRGLQSYPVAALPTGTILDFDSPLIIIVGKNGSGKSTLLQKLEVETTIREHFSNCANIPKYLELEYDGSKPNFHSFHDEAQPDGLNSFRTTPKTEMDKQRYQESKMSAGEYRWKRLQEFFEEVKNPIFREDRIFSIDQPEKDLDIVAKPRMIGKICELVKQYGNQFIVITHEAGFLDVHKTHGIDAKVVSLLETPARSYRVQDFDLRKYIT